MRVSSVIEATSLITFLPKGKNSRDTALPASSTGVLSMRRMLNRIMPGEHAYRPEGGFRRIAGEEPADGNDEG